jgi:hypothetical protein
MFWTAGFRSPLTIAAATAATEYGQVALTFDGAEKLILPPGAEAASDPMDLVVASGADLFLSPGLAAPRVSSPDAR